MLSCHLHVVVGVGRKEKKEEGEEGGWMACEIVLAMVAVSWTGRIMVVMVVKEEEEVEEEEEEEKEEEGKRLTAVLMRAVCCVGTRNAKNKHHSKNQ